MSEPSLPPLVRADLDALGAENRRDLLRREHMYRDDRLGTEARRDHLAAQRRFELATLPLALANVYAHRVARAATGAAALAGSVLILVAISHPRMFIVAGTKLGGEAMILSPLMLAIIANMLLLVVHTVATRIAEGVFTRRMAQSIAPTGDVHGDLDRLADGPIDVARRLVRSVDGWAVGLTATGAIALGVVFGAMAFVELVGHKFPGAWARGAYRIFEPLQHNSTILLLVLALGVWFVVALGRACDREHRRGELPWWARILEHRAIVPLGLAACAGAVFLALRLTRHTMTSGRLPWYYERLAVALVGAAALVAVISAIVLGIRRREEERCKIPSPPPAQPPGEAGSGPAIPVA
jgi:hypothetical protein